MAAKPAGIDMERNYVTATMYASGFVNDVILPSTGQTKKREY